jgi:hypothetical protein
MRMAAWALSCLSEVLRDRFASEASAAIYYLPQSYFPRVFPQNVKKDVVTFVRIQGHTEARVQYPSGSSSFH